MLKHFTEKYLDRLGNNEEFGFFSQFLRIAGRELNTLIPPIQKQISLYDNTKGHTLIDDLQGPSLITGGLKMLSKWSVDKGAIPTKSTGIVSVTWSDKTSSYNIVWEDITSHKVCTLFAFLFQNEINHIVKCFKM